MSKPTMCQEVPGAYKLAEEDDSKLTLRRVTQEQRREALDRDWETQNGQVTRCCRPQ